MTNNFSSDQLVRFARTVVDAVRTPTVVIDGSLSVQAANAQFARLVEQVTLTGKQLLELNDGALDKPSLRDALERVLPASKAFDDVEVSVTDSEVLLVSGKALPTEGEDELIVLALESVDTEQRTADALGSDWLFRAIVDSVHVPMLAISFTHDVRFANTAFFRTFRVSADDILGRPLHELGTGQWDIVRLRELLQRVPLDDTTFEGFEVEYDFPELGNRIMVLNGRRIDHLRLMLLSFEDVTESRQESNLQDARISELAHAIKNLFAMVQALAHQTSAPDVEAYRDALLGRVKALAMSHGVLLERDWQQGDLRKLLTGLLLPHLDGTEDRIEIDGDDVMLSKEQTTAMGLIANELATNATKYGALSTPSGRVSVTWAVKDDRLLLNWNEEGGPPVEGDPESGFGSYLIEQLGKNQLKGTVEPIYDAGGLRVRLEFPLANRA